MPREALVSLPGQQVPEGEERVRGPAHNDAEPGGSQWVRLPDLPNLPAYPELFFSLILCKVYSTSYSMGKV